LLLVRVELLLYKNVQEWLQLVLRKLVLLLLLLLYLLHLLGLLMVRLLLL
jgi:hypothetical protein